MFRRCCQIIKQVILGSSAFSGVALPCTGTVSPFASCCIHSIKPDRILVEISGLAVIGDGTCDPTNGTDTVGCAQLNGAYLLTLRDGGNVCTGLAGCCWYAFPSGPVSTTCFCIDPGGTNSPFKNIRFTIDCTSTTVTYKVEITEDTGVARGPIFSLTATRPDACDLQGAFLTTITQGIACCNISSATCKVTFIWF